MRRWTAILLALLLWTGTTGLAEEADPAPTARPYGEAVSPTLRVLLQTLGTRTALGLTLDGAYTAGPEVSIQFAKGTKLDLGLDGERILLRVGGATIDMGASFSLTRHAEADGSAGGIFIHESQKNTLYAGDVQFTVQEGSIRAIVTMHVEDYLYGVVAYEMNDEFPLEALKAQAVAARTYAMQRRARRADAAYDVVDTADDQVFKGLDTRYTQTIQAVDETRGLVGMHNGRYAECFYSASNGGQTALATDVWGGEGDYSYLEIRDDPYDLENPESIVKSAAIAREITAVDDALYLLLAQKAGELLRAEGEALAGEAVGIAAIENVEAVGPVYGGESRQYGTIRFTVQASIRRFLGEGDSALRMLGETETLQEPLTIDLSFYDEVRSLLGISINSSRYELVTVEAQTDDFIVTARRYGHGVGLSQRGAQWMASAYGMTFMDILHFYYPGMEIVQMDWEAQALPAVNALPETLEQAAPRPTVAPTPGPLPALQAGEYYARVNVEDTEGTLNVREGPARDATLVAEIRNGARMIVESETEDGWAKMKTAELEGYVMMTFIVREAQ